MNDIKYAIRSLLNNPGFTAVAVLTIAIGIGGNTAIYSGVSALLLNPLPYPDSHRLVMVDEAPPGGFNSSCGGTFLEWYDNNENFEKLAALHPVDKNLTGRGDPVQVSGWEVTAEFLQVYRILPVLGRDFRPDDDAPGGNHRVAIVTHEFWHTQLGADPDIIGEFLLLDGAAYEVIGVLGPAALMDPGLHFLSPAGILSQEYKQDRNYSYVTTTVGRLKDGATPEQAAAQLTAVKQVFNDQYPAHKEDWTVAVRDLHETMFGDARQPLIILLAAVAVVLLIACANVANLLLARTTSRQGEFAVRLTLGATPGRIVRQMLTESLLLALIGGVCGVWLGSLAIGPLATFSGMDEIQGLEFGLNTDVLAFAIGATLVTGLLFGLLPALRAANPDVHEQLKDGMRGSAGGKRRRLQSMLVVSETALTVVLLVVAGLLMRSFINVARVDPGFIREGALTFHVAQSGDTAETNEKRTQFTDSILRELEQIPGATSAAMASSLPMDRGQNFGDNIYRVDRPETANTYGAGFDAVSPNYFETMGIPLLRGRTLAPGDNRENAPKVMVVSQALVDDLYDEDEDPLGSQLFFKGEPWEIVGIVGGIRRYSLAVPLTAQVYYAQIHFPWYTEYVVRTSLPPLSLASQVRQAVRNVHADQPISNLSTLEQISRDTLSFRTMMLTLLGLFAGVALLLACIGIYGVMAYSTSRRTREIGIRLALGAVARDVVRLIVADGLKLIAVGLAIGAVLAGFSTRILASQLYDVGRFDPAVFIVVSFILIAVGTLACSLPALRAARIDPMKALRTE